MLKVQCLGFLVAVLFLVGIGSLGCHRARLRHIEPSNLFFPWSA